MKRRAHALAAVATAFGLAGCQPVASDSWFPLVAGREQVYQVRMAGESATTTEWTLRVQGPADIDGQAVMVRHHSVGVSYYLREDEAGIRRLATRLDIDAEPSRDAQALWVLKAPYRVGTEWTTPTVPYLIVRKNEYPRELRDSHRALMYWRIESVDDEVTTATGTHKPCLRVVGRASLNLYTDPVNGFNDVPLTSREWYCKGSGLVKFERDETVAPGFMVGGTLKAEWVR
jgi:hypothetical protein